MTISPRTAEDIKVLSIGILCSILIFVVFSAVSMPVDLVPHK